MAAILTGDALYGTLAPRKVGTATVHDVVKLTYDPGTMDAPDYPGTIVGRIVQRDGLMFARDVSSCGAPLRIPVGYRARLGNALDYAARFLLSENPAL